ncbi:MAG: UbiA family prenyltransferase [Nitrospirae bacterium]|nr:UbiA family prenyltransferase [Nitrospirota bacterium]
MSFTTLDDQSILDKAPELNRVSGTPVMCVDLDGTLLATDSLWESIFTLLKQNPWSLLYFLPWLLQGKAKFKSEISKLVSLDPKILPYRMEVLSYLETLKKEGRELILVTGSHERIAHSVADHLGIFSEVIASNDHVNLTGTIKARILEKHFGAKGFDYMGDSSADLQVWPMARHAILVHPSQSVLRQASDTSTIHHVFPSPHNSISLYLKAFRSHQWVKNTLLFLPLLSAHHLFNIQALFLASMAFISFSLWASAFYIVNDLIDLPADRRHPHKQHRPFASGSLSITQGLTFIPVLLGLSLGISFLTLPINFSIFLGLYALITTAYSLVLKKMVILDVLTLAGFYTLRVVAGGAAVGVPISAWLLAFSVFFFLSLAFGKRHAELQLRKVSRRQGIERRAYLGVDKEMLAVMGTTSGYLSVLVLALYINSPEVFEHYSHPNMLWLACPILLYWISKTWILAHRGNLDDDPLVIALQDPTSYVLATLLSLLVFFAI